MLILLTTGSSRTFEGCRLVNINEFIKNDLSFIKVLRSEWEYLSDTEKAFYEILNTGWQDILKTRTPFDNTYKLLDIRVGLFNLTVLSTVYPDLYPRAIIIDADVCVAGKYDVMNSSVDIVPMISDVRELYKRSYVAVSLTDIRTDIVSKKAAPCDIRIMKGMIGEIVPKQARKRAEFMDTYHKFVEYKRASKGH